MKTRDALFRRELEALLERCRELPAVPANQRMRSLARARAAAARTAPFPAEAAPVARRRGLVVALAASLAFVIGVGVASAAFYAQSRLQQPARSAEPPNRRVELYAPAPAIAPEADLPETVLPLRPQHAGRMTSTQESYAAELRLLQGAQAAYAGRAYSRALSLVAEHRRRFPRGRLTEEREALRVRALSKAGRAPEAERAAKAFAERFPRSVLLPRSGEIEQR